MRKKFFAMYALVGALVASPVFTSCIDGEESSSVTAVRNERAAAIKAKIAMEQAEAERKAQLEELKLAADMANYEQQKAMYEKYLLDYQLQIEKAKKDLKDYQETTLSELTDAYTKALSLAATAEWQVVKYNQQIANLKEDFASAKEAVAEQTENYNNEIAQFEAKIAEAKKLQEAGMDKSSMNEKLAELKLAYETANKELGELILQYGQNAANTDVMKAIQFFNTNGLYVYTEDKNDLYVLDNSEVLYQQRTFAQNAETYKKNLDDAIAALGTEKDTEKTTISVENDNLTAYAELVRTTKQMEAADALLAKLEKALADAKTALAADEDDTDLQQDVIDAQNALTNFKNDATNTTYNHDGDEEGVKDAGYRFAKNELSTAEMGLANAKDDVIYKEKILANNTQTSTEFEEALKAFEGEAYEAYKTAVAELEAADKAATAAYNEWDALDDFYDSYNDGIYNIYRKIWNGSEYVYQPMSLTTAEYIEYCEEYIETYKEYIAELEAVVEHDGVEADSEEALAVLIAYFEKQIAIEEAELVLYNKMVEEAKAALDAYLAE